MQKHPDLAKKFLLLFKLRINPSITSYTDLANRLGITKQSISRWVHGTDTSQGGNIPNAQIEKVARFYWLDPSSFLLGFEEFELAVNTLAEKLRLERSVRPEKISLSLMPLAQADIYGREEEMALLDSIWDEKKVNMLEVVAFGGMGKSSFVNHWLSHMDRENYKGARFVYAWSFYWQGSSSDLKSTGDLFIEHALEWFGDVKATEGTPWAKATRLAELIRQSRTLLILDGLEPLQHPPGEKVGEVETPAVGLLLKELATDNTGLCIVTTRLAVADINPYRDTRVLTLDLESLSKTAGTQLLRNMGLEGEKAQFELAVEEYEGHPFSLSLLGGYLKVAHNGEINKFRDVQSLLDNRSQSTHAKKLMSAYVDWFEGTPELSLFRLIGLFDRPVNIEELRAIILLEEINGLTSDLVRMSSADLSYTIQNLCDARIISINNSSNGKFVDSHPLVRDFIGDYLQKNFESIWKRGHGLIFDYLLTIADETPTSMSGIEPLLRAVIHGTRADRYEESYQVYYDRVKKGQISICTEGSHHADLACIRSFFIKEWDQPVDQISESAGYYLMSCAAANQIYLGEIEKAIKPSKSSIEWFIANNKLMEALNAIGPLTSMLTAAGRVAEGIELIENVRDVIQLTNNPLVEAMGKVFIAYGYFLEGQFEDAIAIFEETEQVLLLEENTFPFVIPTISSYYCQFLLQMGDLEAALARSMKTFGWRRTNAWQTSIDTTSMLASDLMVRGLIHLNLGNLADAESDLNREVELLRSLDEWLYLPTGLNSRALYYFRDGKLGLAEKDLSEALTISQKTGAKFSEWESYLGFSQLHLLLRNPSLARSYLTKAHALTGMDAYKFRDAEIAELEKGISLLESEEFLAQKQAHSGG